MTGLPSVFATCQPHAEILAGELPDALFAADLWDVLRHQAHRDYQDAARFFAGTHPTASLKLLLKDVAERLAGAQGGTSTFRLETGFGGGKTHSLIATVHVAREGRGLAPSLAEYGLSRLPEPGLTRIAAFVGENSDPLSGTELEVEGQRVRTFTPWGQLALMAGGLKGYEVVKDNDQAAVAPSRDALEAAFGSGPVLVLLDELVLYMARCFALPEASPRQGIGSQWAAFLQTLLSVAAHRPQTVVLLTLPSEQDANRRVTGELRDALPSVLDVVDGVEKTAARQARNLTPTQTTERAAVLARRLFDSVVATPAGAVADAFAAYYQEQRDAGVAIDARAFEPGYRDQLCVGYPFHPELIRLFSERLADIPEFQATRGALRLVARTVRSVWSRQNELGDTPLLQPHHVDLSRPDLRDEVLARLGRTAFERGLDVDVANAAGGTHTSQVEGGWPWRAASESCLLAFLHSLPDGSRGVTASEVALAVGRPGVDLGYVARGLEDTERKAWYMRREGEHFLFRTRASINKRFHEHLTRLEAEPAVVRQTLDDWVQKLYSGLSSFQTILFPLDHTAVADNADRLRLIVIHYDKECGQVGGGDRLDFTKRIFTTAGVNEAPRGYRNNLVFLLAEPTRTGGLKEGARALIAWERVEKDLETEQSNLAQAGGSDYQTLKKRARLGAAGVPAEFLALESDLSQVLEKRGQQEVNVRTRVLEAYRVLAFPTGGRDDDFQLFGSQTTGPLLECYRVDFGEVPEETQKGTKGVNQPVTEGPILQCLRHNQKLVPEATPLQPLVLAPALLRRAPLWKEGETKVSTADLWDRIRREPDAPMLLRPTDLLPTLREGLVSTPEAHWVYYNQEDRRVWNRDSAPGLSPVIAPDHYLYDLKAASLDRVVPVAVVSSQEVWDHLWPRDGVTPVASVCTATILAAAKLSPRFPVLPDRGVLWQALQDGLRENRWVLYLRGPNLALGAKELAEWPGTPRIEDGAELWTYQGALDQGFYPRRIVDGQGEPTTPLTPHNLRSLCWPAGTDRLSTEEFERLARSVWPDASRPRLEDCIEAGVQAGTWGLWREGPDESYHANGDTSPLPGRVGPGWTLIDPASALASELQSLRPGMGPQPVDHLGTPREVLTHLWESLATFKDVRVVSLMLAVDQRDGFDNTLRATWADRPRAAVVSAAVSARGQRSVGGATETIQLNYAGRFEELTTMLAPVWPFQSTGELDVTIEVLLRFDTPVLLTDGPLTTYRTALMSANQGTLHARAVPARKHLGGGA
jgi:hypothetical protein